MQSKKKIRGVSDLIKIIKDIKIEGKSLVFRGHSSADYKLEPSLFRGQTNVDKFLQTEYDMYHRMVSNNPEDFPVENTYIDNLIKMQHYGLPTRLLDFSYNPLVALYFASLESQNTNNSKEGEVFVISNVVNHQIDFSPVYSMKPIPFRITIFNFTFSFLDSLKKNIENWIKDTQNSDKKICELLSNKLKDLETYYKNAKKSLLNHNFSFTNIKKIYDQLDKLTLEIYEMATSDLQKVHLLHQILIEAAAFYEESIFKSFKTDYKNIYNIQRDLLQPVLFNASLNNERIKRQQGLFAILPDIFFENRDLFNLTYKENIHCFIVPLKDKKNILSELDSLGINESFLFPDLETQSKTLKSHYGYN